MISTQSRRAGRSEAERRRRREIERCLARWELLRRPHPLYSGAGGPAGAGLGRRLRGVLEELGPVFSAFGVYLASRIDLVTASDALELAAIPDRTMPLPAAAVSERIAAELGHAAGDRFAVLEEAPCESRLLVQMHAARLTSGEPVFVHLVRPEAGEEVELELELLPSLAEALAVQGWPEAALGEAVDDFRRDLLQQTDLLAAARSLELLAGDAATCGRLVAPRVYRELTTSRLLIVADVGGVPLGAAVRMGASRPWDPAGDPRELARSLCFVWLHQALMGRAFPVELRGDLRVLPDGRIALPTTGLALPPVTVQANLRAFVIAVATREPDEACTCLLRELAAADDALPEEQLRLHLRQIVPFRDGAWSASGESLAEHLFVYARIARASGYRPRFHLLAFYRGLFAAAAAARRLAPERDSLYDGLQELRVLTSFSQVHDAISPGGWSGQLDRYAALMAALPQRLDELLTLAAEGGVRPAAETAPPRRAESPHLVLAASLLVLAASALLLHHFVQAGALAGRGETIAATLFLAVGGILLWNMARSR